jgi:FkbM family methyltransferase
MDFIFQKICNIIPAYKIDTKFKKKFFYIFFSIVQFFLKGPFVMNFKNFKIFAYPTKGDYTRYILTRVEIPDPRERNLITQNLNNENNIFIDCGANAGFYSLDVSTKVKNILVYAFEPSKEERFFLKNNLILNNLTNVQIVDLAVGKENGTAIFNDTRDLSYNNSSGGGFITTENPKSHNNYEVQVINLDTFFKDKDLSNKTSIFIKIDLEGYDLKAINGAKNLMLNYDCTVIFEFSKMIMEQSDYNIKDIDYFLDRGFILYDIYGQSIKSTELEKKIYELDQDHDTCGNFILSKKKLNFNF